MLLMRQLFGEADDKYTQQIAIRGLHINARVDGRLPFFDEGAKMVTSKIHAMKISKTMPSLDLFDYKAELAESLIRIFIQVAEAELNHTVFQPFAGNFRSLSSRDERTRAGSYGEERRSLNFIPFFFQEGVDSVRKSIITLV